MTTAVRTEIKSSRQPAPPGVHPRERPAPADRLHRRLPSVRGLRAQLLFTLTACFLLAVGPVAHGQLVVTNSLWPDGAPLGDGQVERAQAILTLHRPPPEKATGTAIVICPGGGYGGLVTGAEGHGIARWLNTQGIAGLVLEYRLPRGRPLVPLLDAQRAIRTARFKATSWGLRPNRIGIVGFSAGGHLASTAATHFDQGRADALEPIDRLSCRPDFAILVYPVVSMTESWTHGGSRENLLGRTRPPELEVLYSNERQVTHQTPPIFLAHAKDDTAVPAENSRRLYEALRAHHVPTEYLELPSGGHGLNGYQGPMWDAWQTKSIHWLRAQKFLSSAAPSP